MITLLYWASNADYRGNDIHMIRNGTTINLKNILALQQDIAPTVAWLSGVTDATFPDFDRVEFIPQWEGASAAGATNTKAGITVHKTDGTIKVDPHPGGANLNIHNFVLKVTVYKKLAAGSVETSVRIHIHDSITKAWLTPTPLTVPFDTESMRFAIYAQFKNDREGSATAYDEVVGDISYHEGTVWECLAANLSCDPASGLLDPQAGSIGNSYKVTATLGPMFGSLAVTVPGDNVDVTDSWDAPTVPANRIVAAATAGNPGIGQRTKVSNILFLSDAYLAAGKGDFETCAAEIKADMAGGNPLLRPWDLVIPNTNVWTAFHASRQNGCTILSEVVPYETKIAAAWVWRAKSVEEFVADSDQYLLQNRTSFVRNINYGANIGAPIAAPSLLLSELIDLVGLPVPSDAGIAIAAKRAEWRNLYDATITSWDQGAATPLIPHVEEDVFKLWKVMADRRMVNERDTAFGTCFGGKPKYEGEAAGRSYALNEMRLSRQDIQKAITKLTLGTAGAVVLGDVFAGDPASATPAKDFSNVVILGNGSRYGGAQSPNASDNRYADMITTSLHENTEIQYTTVPGYRVLELVPEARPVHAVPDNSMTVSHELGHGQSLGDEYGIDADLDLNTEEQARSYYPNLVPESDLKPVAAFEGDLIKWRWPRISNGARLSDPVGPKAGGGLDDFTIKIKKAPATPFAKDDLVYLRKKDINQVNTSQITYPQYSGLLKIDTVVSTKEFHVKHLAGHGIPPAAADFPEGSVLVKLTPAEFKGGGTVTHAAGGSKKVIGGTVGADTTHFFFQAAVGDRISLTIGGNAEYRRITAINSDSELEIDSDFSAAVAVKADYRLEPVHTFKAKGTVTVAGTAVTGVGTKFKEQVNVGDEIKVGADIREITTIASDIAMTIDTAIGGGAGPGADLFIRPAKNYAEMIESSMRRAITASNNPMTAAVCAPVGIGVERQNPVVAQIVDGNGSLVYPKLNTPSAANRYRVVGLYAGGADFACGLYHPIGHCFMRSLEATVVEFCPICRYVMVDRMDPSKHDVIDSNYSTIYPKI